MKIILGVCGSVAAYKSFDLLRTMLKQGHEVIVVLTQGALKFVRPELFKYLGAKEIYLAKDDFAPHRYQSDQQVLHISLARWLDRLVLAPSSASFLARLARGEASDLLSSIFLSINDRPVIVYPAMNTQMWNHPFTQENLNKLKSLSWVGIYPPVVGEMACKEFGVGKLPEIEAIADTFWCYPVKIPGNISENEKGIKKKILITTGATAAILDPIRFLTNPSTGETGRQLAQEFLASGHEVTVIAGKSATKALEHLIPLPGFTLLRASTTSEVKKIVDKLWPKFNVYISAAALSDFDFQSSQVKISKSSVKNSLPVSPAPDVLAGVIRMKRPGQTVIGFAAQSPLTKELLKEKYGRKPVDLLIGNVAHHGLGAKNMEGFGNNSADYLIIKKGQIIHQGPLAKRQLAILIEQAWAQ